MTASFAPRIINRYEVATKGGTRATFEIRAGRGYDPRELANLYNVRLKTQNPGLTITPEQVEFRLARDPECLHVGLLGGQASIMAIVKRVLPRPIDIPKTRDELTDRELYTNTDPDHGNTWLCPMVTVDPTFGGFKAVIGGRERSLGQLHAHTVGLEAVAHPAVRNLLTFTPPMGLRAYVEKMLGTKLIFTQDPASRTVRFVAESTGRRLVTDALGVRFEFEGARLLTIASYWGARDERQRRVEPAYQFHSENGAGIRLDLVMDNGDWQDPESLAFRTVLEYPLNK